MLLHLKDGKVLQAPGDISTEAAQTLIDNGEAVQVTRLRINQDVRHSSSEYAAHFDAGETVAIPKDVPEGLAKLLLVREPANVEPANDP